MKTILIADPDYNLTFTLEKLLKAEKYEVLSCNSAEALLGLTESQGYDLIIVNPMMRTADGTDIIQKLKKRQECAAFLVIYEDHAAERISLPRIFDQIEKPIDFRSTINRIRELFTSGGFSGIITGINLTDYIQMFCMNRVTKAILVRKDGHRGILLIDDGQVVYADTVGLKGEEAFYEILSWPQGQIKEVKIKKFPAPNINKDFQQLLLGSALIADESRARNDTQDEMPGALFADETPLGHDARDEVPGIEMITALHNKETQAESTHIAIDTLKTTAHGTPSKRGFFRSRIGMGAAVLAIVLIGLIFSLQNIFKDEGKAGKMPLQPTANSREVFTRYDTAKDTSGVRTLDQNSSLTEKTPETDIAKRPQSEQSITVSQLVPQESTLHPEDVLLRFHGSNTIGAQLAPALVIAYLETKLNAADIQTLPGEKEDEQIIKAIINGKKVAVEIRAHGSTTAFEGLKTGTCDIGNASRKIKDKEVEALSFLGDMNSISSEHVIGLDGIAVLVNKANDIKTISNTVLEAVFSGKTTDWKDMNGRDGGITVYARDDKSGTYDTFKSLILGEKNPLVSSAKRYESNADLSDDVSRDPSGIGFTGLPYVRNAKALAVSEEGAQAIYPNFFTVAGEDYPISRRLYMYTASIPKNPHVAPFINFVLSNEGQKIVEKIGFVDMNIRAITMDPPDTGHIVSVQRVRDYLNAVKNAQRLSLNFRFKKNLTVLDNRSVRDLDRIISFLADKLDKKIILAGFADASGDYEYNHKLAMTRAQLVGSELKARGIAVSDIFSCGQEMPVASNMTEQGKEKNRRVEVWLK
jgi:phosphate transport system substrate-binding protein